MKPINFRRANGILTRGAQKFQDVGDLPVYRTAYRSEPEVISCWRPSLRERLSVLFLGRVWLRISSPQTHPPVCLEGLSPFPPQARFSPPRLNT